MAGYIKLDTIHRPSTGAVAPAAWGDAINDNIDFLANSDSTLVLAGETTASTSFTNLSTVGPVVSITTGASALVIVSAFISDDTATASTLMGVAVSGATTIAAADVGSLTVYHPDIGSNVRLSFMFPFFGLTPGVNVFTAKYRVSAGTGTWAERRVTVLPLA